MATDFDFAFPKRLLSLPPELRYQIYEYALISPDPIILDQTEYEPPSLLYANRHFIDRETLESTYYSSNNFAYIMTGSFLAKNDFSGFLDCIRELGPGRIELMRTIDVVSYWVCKDRDLEVLTGKLEEALEDAGLEVERGFVRCVRTGGPCKVM